MGTELRFHTWKQKRPHLKLNGLNVHIQELFCGLNLVRGWAVDSCESSKNPAPVWVNVCGVPAEEQQVSAEQFLRFLRHYLQLEGLAQKYTQASRISACEK